MNHDPDLAQPGVVLFTTPGCPHCPRVRDISKEVSRRRSDVHFIEVSAAKPGLADSMKVRAAPTAIAMRDGAEVDRVVGAANVAEIERLFNAAAGAISPGRRPLVSAENRKVRTATGLALIVAGLITQVIWLTLIGAALGVSGWHDYLVPPRRKP